MVAAGWGRLLATSSIAGAAQGWPRHVHYTAAKAGIVGLVRSLFLASERASYVTGQTIVVDGGVTLSLV